MKLSRLFLLLLYVMVLQGCLAEENVSGDEPTIKDPLPTLIKKIASFSSCDELQDWYHERTTSWTRLRVNPVFLQASGISAPAATTVSNLQVDGLDEPDLVKAFGDRLYYARSRSVEVLSAHDLAAIETLHFRDLTELRLLQSSRRLIVLGRAPSGIRLHIYKESGRLLEKEKTFEIRGTLLTARVHQDDLTLITQEPLDGSPPSVPCDRIYRPATTSFEFMLTAIHTIDLRSPEISYSAGASVGAVDQVYMSKKNLYLFDTGYNWFPWDTRLANDPLYHSSIVRRFELRPAESPRLTGVAAVNGTVRNNLAFHEDPSGRYLFVATTLSDLRTNRIWVLADRADRHEDSPFDIVAKSVDFGAREDIRAVRFFNERAYVVTFERTDPLFVFDLHDPLEPRLLSELELPGFSAYLHPLSPKRLFGAGYAAMANDRFTWLAGLRFSLFEIDNDGAVSLVAQKQLGGNGSHVEAAHDYHAFTLDETTGQAVLPVRLMADSNDAPWAVSSEVEFSGALVFDPSTGMAPIGRLSHQEWIPQSCHWRPRQVSSGWNFSPDSPDIRRVVALKSGLISLSPFGAKLHDRHPPFATRAERPFAEADLECSQPEPSPAFD